MCKVDHQSRDERASCNRMMAGKSVNGRTMWWDKPACHWRGNVATELAKQSARLKHHDSLLADSPYYRAMGLEPQAEATP